MNRVYVYLNGTEELGEIIEKIKGTPEKEIVLVVPPETKSLLHPINLDIFKNELEKLKKKVYLDTDDDHLIDLAKKKGINLFLLDQKEELVMDIKPPHLLKEKTLEIEKKSISSSSNFFQFLFKLLKTIFSALFFSGLILGVGFLTFTFFRPKAEINIEIQRKKVAYDEVIKVKEKILENDYENKIIKGEYVKIELVKTETLKPTGQKTTQLPLLKVRFLNYLEREIPLIAGTRVVYEDNVFRIVERIVIPPKTEDKPGEFTVDALPDSANKKITISKDTELKIPGLEGKKLDSGYWTDYIKAFVNEDYPSQISETNLVLPEDITQIKLNLEKSLISAIQGELALKYPDSLYPFDPSLVKINNPKISHQVGDKTDVISATGKAVFEIFVFSKKDFEELIRFILEKEIQENKENYILENNRLLTLELIDLDMKNKTMIVGVKGEAEVASHLNGELIKKDIAGKSLDEVKEYFNKIKGINSVKIRIFPQWKNRLPEDLNRIQIEIK